MNKNNLRSKILLGVQVTPEEWSHFWLFLATEEEIKYNYALLKREKEENDNKKVF